MDDIARHIAIRMFLDGFMDGHKDLKRIIIEEGGKND